MESINQYEHLHPLYSMDDEEVIQKESPVEYTMPQSLPPESWDCHIHCFDPEQYPFKKSRAYTPPAATLDSLIQQNRASNLMLVQASIEDGYDGLLAHLSECKERLPSATIHGTICNNADNLSGLSDEEFDLLHRLGVRSIRIHGFHNTDGHPANQIEAQFRALSRCCGVAKYGWSISAQLPLQTWASLKSFILTSDEMSHVRLIADHNGCVTPEDLHSPALDVFADLLRSGRLYVKVCALYRRSPDDIHQMKAIIQQFANARQESLLWGSDWPHVDSTGKSPSTAKELDIDAELETLRQWLTDDQWQKMLVENPNRVFDHTTACI